MPKGSSNIVHQYFKKEDAGGKTLLKVNPIHLTGIEIVVPPEGEPESNEIEVPQGFETDLAAEGFTPCSPLEFNLYWSGLV
ncbi:MAG TPA: hypothetical protein VFE50_09735 [Cyclobacteriaceae bacterium]|nr:hypothetical protein [Cyclobacteriaceae bacterium]